VLIPGLLLGVHGASRSSATSSAGAGSGREASAGVSPRLRPRGFTLLEMLVSIAIVAVLAGLLMLGLAGVRGSGRQAATLANLRTHHNVFSLYAGDHAGWLPLLGEPAPTVLITSESGDQQWLMLYWFHYGGWHLSLAEAYYNTHLDPRLFLSPHNPEQKWAWGPWGATVADYEYSSAFVARPEYWAYETRTGPEQWGGNRLDEVLFASKKVLLRETWPHWQPGATNGVRPWPRRSAVTVAGEAHGFTSFPPSKESIYLKGDGDYEGAVLLTGLWGLHTLHGARGRDLQ